MQRPGQPLRPLQLRRRGRVVEVAGVACVGGTVAKAVAEQMVAAATEMLRQQPPSLLDANVPVRIEVRGLLLLRNRSVGQVGLSTSTGVLFRYRLVASKVVGGNNCLAVLSGMCR